MEPIKSRGELERQSLIADLEEAAETLHQNAERIQVLEKNWAESEWYLGEARARIQRLEDELRDKEHYLRKMDEDARVLRQQFEESQWYLSEARDRCQALEQRLGQIKLSPPGL